MPNERYRIAGYIGARLVFLLTELFAILAAVFPKPEATFLAGLFGISKPTPDMRVNALLVVALSSFGLTLFITIFINPLVSKLIRK